MGEALADDLRDCYIEPTRIADFFAAEPQGWFIKVAKPMEQLDSYVGSARPALQQAPAIFESVGVNLSVHVCDRMIR